MSTSARSASRSGSLLSAPPPAAAIEIAAGRISVAEVGSGADGLTVNGFASEPLPESAVTPSLTGVNIADPAAVTAALKRAYERAGIRAPRRAALIVPDSVARLTLLTFEELPPKAADADQLIRWQIRKATPFPLEDAQVTHVVTHQAPGATTVAAIVARRDVIAQYEQVVTPLGILPGIVDLASLNVVNAVLAGGAAPAGDWLLVSVARESTALAIVRSGQLMFYRLRLSIDDEPLGALVHQTSMYHQDRLGGGTFARVWLCGAAWADGGGETIRREISDRLGVQAEPVDVRVAATMRDRIGVSPDVLDAMAAPMGVLLRERKGA
jgi:Tfp pilus assembly PilM family ATPase